ncbi:hypothetical protein [Umezawaea beigongshangensis]|uniref:hypothetical protein n=1 Tax=Umezawaea beigongshangensis TaxID=2780383 RepID=UPI0018F19D94|nr:hypothetical protein [Umezawaea beigongshangensis]
MTAPVEVGDRVSVLTADQVEDTEFFHPCHRFGEEGCTSREPGDVPVRTHRPLRVLGEHCGHDQEKR